MLRSVSYLCLSDGLILSGAAKPLGSSGAFIMGGGGAGVVATCVLACIPACPTVVYFLPSDLWRRLCDWISYLPE